MQKLSAFFVFFISLFYFGQIKFEKGYFIDNNGVKNEVLIKNEDWYKNPTNFIYKTNENSEELTKNITELNAFEIFGESKYIKKTVLMDTSPEDLNNLSDQKDPVFVEETVFLKVVLDGKASLYKYVNANAPKYFYSIDYGKTVNELINKSYSVSNENGNNLATNDKFRDQIKKDLSCSAISNQKINNLRYTNSDFVSLFKEYNSCENSGVSDYEPAKKTKLTNITIKAGANFSSLSVVNSTNNTDYDFGKKTNLRVGVEFEHIFAFNQKKWSIFAEPSYQSYKNEIIRKKYAGDLFDETEKIGVVYQSIEIPLGLRFYTFINNDSKIFYNAAYVVNFNNSKSEITTENEDILKVKSTFNFFVGVGYKYKRFSVEGRYYTDREIMDNRAFSSKYKTISFLLGYQVF